MTTTKRHYVEVAPGVELYVEEAGEGPPLVFIPGWTGTTESFSQQLAHFSGRSRAVTFDPRCQGRSTTTITGVSYRQQGRDLATLIERLGLKSSVLIPWSYGCLAVWEYVRQFGTSDIAALVFIDQSPQNIARPPDFWSDGDIETQLRFRRQYMDDPRGFIRSFVEAIFEEPRSEKDIESVVDDCMRTPPFAGSLLAADGLTRDETDIAEAIDGKVPVLHVVSKENEATARDWLARHCPSARIEAFGTHRMVVQQVDRFNATVDKFFSEHGL